MIGVTVTSDVAWGAMQGVAGKLTTKDEEEALQLIALLVDGLVPVDGLQAHALTQPLPCLIRQLGQEGVEVHQDDGELINHRGCVHGFRCTAMKRKRISTLSGLWDVLHLSGTFTMS